MTEMYLGSNEVQKMYLGINMVDRVYKGNGLIFGEEPIRTKKPIVYLPLNTETGYSDFGDNSGDGLFTVNWGSERQPIRSDNPKFGSGYMWCDGYNGDGQREEAGLYNSVPEMNLNTNDFTIEFWCYRYIDGHEQQYATAFAEFHNPYEGGSLWFRIRDVDQGSNASARYLGNLGYIIPQSWTHVAVARNGSNLSCYFNGVKTKELSNFTANVNLNMLSIGGLGEPSTLHRGGIDDFAVWDYAKYLEDFTPPTEPVYSPAITAKLRVQAKRLKAKRKND